jgi:DNA invertase Pin-like site-specific DNA recombinase
MAIFGYARVSTADQDLAIQDAALRAAGCTVIRAEKATGTKLTGRNELRKWLIPFATVRLAVDRLRI